MDKRRIILNVSISILSKVILLIVSLIVRRLLIRYIGNDINGLNSLFTSIVGMLSVAELGVGSAIVFSMYSPIVAGEQCKIEALYCLYKKLYRIIGGVIFVAGLAVMPFLPKLISDYDNLNINVYGTFFLTLIAVVLSYLYSAKTSLIEAHKDNYITTGILTVARLVKYTLQIAAILIWKSYSIYLVCRIIETVFIWLVTEKIVRCKYGEIIVTREKVDEGTRIEITKNIKAMFMHKVGTILVNTIDSVIISAFIGVAILGRYSNYTVIAGIIMSLISLFFTPLTSVVGHLCAAGDAEKTKKYYDYFFCLNYILGVFFYLGYYAVIDNVVTLLFGTGLQVSRTIVFVITLNQFTQYMRRSTLLFRDASGAFYYDRWKPIAEGLSNLVLSLIFVNVFPEQLRIVGVIVATIITTLLICDTVEPFILFRYVFKKSLSKFYVKYYVYIGLFVFCLVLVSTLMQKVSNPVTAMLVNGSIAVLVSFVAFGLLSLFDNTFRNEARTMWDKALKMISY